MTRDNAIKYFVDMGIVPDNSLLMEAMISSLIILDEVDNTFIKVYLKDKFHICISNLEDRLETISDYKIDESIDIIKDCKNDLDDLLEIITWLRVL